MILTGLAAGVWAAPAGKPVFADLPPAILSEKQRTEDGGRKTEDAAEAKAEGRMQNAENRGGTNAAAGTMSVPGYVPDDKYKLRVGDKVSLQILEDRILGEKEAAPKSLVVTDSGELDAPYVGRVAAADKTCKQLAEDLKARLEKEYYHQATVVISLDAANKLLGRAYVWGQVRQQGAIEMAANENLTAGKAILRAGGFGDFANKKKVKLVRGGEAGGAASQTFLLNMVEILEQGRTELDMALQPDDFIIVPSRLINF